MNNNWYGRSGEFFSPPFYICFSNTHRSISINFIYKGGLYVRKRMDEIKSSLSEILELPKDIVLDLPKITMIGNLQVYIENHKGIIEYSKQRIRINTNIGILRITGKDMYIRNIVTEEVIVVGEIAELEFQE